MFKIILKNILKKNKNVPVFLGYQIFFRAEIQKIRFLRTQIAEVYCLLFTFILELQRRLIRFFPAGDRHPPSAPNFYLRPKWRYRAQTHE